MVENLIIEENEIIKNPMCLLSIMNYIDLGIVIFNKDEEITFANSTFHRLLGHELDVVLGKPLQKFVSNVVDPSAVGEFKRDWHLLVTGQTVRHRLTFKHKQGQKVPSDVTLSPIYNQDGSNTGYLLMIRDLHEELLNQIIHLVNSTHSLEEILYITTVVVTEYLGLCSSAIFLANEEKTKLQCTACNVLTSEEMKKSTFHIGQGPPGVIAKTKKSLYVRDLGSDNRIDPEIRRIHANKSSIGYPLLFKGELLGVIAFDAFSIRDFNEKELILFENIANQVALAINNANLFSRLEHLSITDGLTGLYNHRHFHKMLNDYVAESKTKLLPLCVFMVDVDNFKRFNDTYGHLVGDSLLKELGQLLRANTTSKDVVARYGGEEFAVLILGQSLEEAFLIAQRIRKAVEKHTFSCVKNHKEKITISIGMATLYNHMDKYEFLDCADKALYSAKSLGKNRVEIYDPDRTDTNFGHPA